MRRAFITLAAAAGAALGSWSAEAQAPITLEVRTFVDEDLGRGLAYAGAISSRATGEHVSVLAKVCPRRNYYTVAEAKDRGGRLLAGRVLTRPADGRVSGSVEGPG